jgi:hypothetical protein
MKIKFIERATQRLSRDGLRFTLVRKFAKILGQSDAITIAKQKVLTKLLDEHGAVISHGPFKGVKLSKDSWWGRFDLISKILGIYEPHVVDRLITFAEQGTRTFVDIGSADGYFPIGMMSGEIFKKAYAFEISDEARTKMKLAIERNGCGEKIVVGKEANVETLRQVLETNDDAVILIDIEGAEYDFLDDTALTMIKKCRVICELHPWLVEGGQRKEQELEVRAQKLFRVSFLQRETYEPNKFAELKEFSDDERLLACSEGRGENTRWMVLEPKH